MDNSTILYPISKNKFVSTILTQCVWSLVLLRHSDHGEFTFKHNIYVSNK